MNFQSPLNVSTRPQLEHARLAMNSDSAFTVADITAFPRVEANFLCRKQTCQQHFAFMRLEILDILR